MARTALTKANASGPSRVDQAYQEIKRRILNNVWPPGQQAFEPEVAEKLGMSRTPVREALLRLENDGLIRVIPRRGMYVLPLSRDDMREIYEVLTCLEAMPAELLARRRPSDAELAPMEEAVEEMEAALDRDDLDAWAKADEHFHHTLLDLCGNRRLSTLANTVWDQAHRARMVSLRLRPKPTNSNADHRAVLSAIRRGEAEEAREVQRQHRLRGQNMILAVLDHYRLPQL